MSPNGTNNGGGIVAPTPIKPATSANGATPAEALDNSAAAAEGGELDSAAKKARDLNKKVR
jgi:hypothetical protein